MKALRSFTVRARLPEALIPLSELASNLRWSWDERTRDLFRWVDPQTWELSFHDPVRLLGLVKRDRLDALAADPAFLGFLTEISDDLHRYLAGPRWFQQRHLPSAAGSARRGQIRSALRAVAYFSPEFGIAEAIPQYSGGLGVLAGDHLKGASGLGVPLAGVGLMYGQGYFRQRLNADGWQEEHYPLLDPHRMALTLVDGARVSVDLAGEELVAQIWLAQVGRVKLYLLDADVDDNVDELRGVTDRLYGGGTEHRLRQEILLGVGGVRALAALGAETQVFHTNEGHAGFIGLERIRRLITTEGLGFADAVEAVRSGTVFTTHTPVPAGIDRFPRDLMERYFKSWSAECEVSIDALMTLGHFPGEPLDAPFNMAIMGLRLAGMSNGVAKLHGSTSRSMFQGLWPEVPANEVPISSVTNGVHGRTWVSSEMSDLFSKYVSPAWDEAGATEWSRIDDARDDELWRAREQGREALIDVVRDRLRQSLLDQGMSPTDAAWADEVLDPRYLVIGFGRRFATYKRATLLLGQPERLRALLLDQHRPIQLVFAGKAHPADDLGKQMISEIVRFSRDPAVRHRITFVPDYDISVARMMYQGSDVWLNTPRRPMEASGTSGEKAALNGALNCSILDGWWDECFDGDNGWAISSAESYGDVGQRDRVEADSLFEILERQVVPLFYDRSEGRFPRAWVQRMKASLRALGPRVQASRMVRDYVERFYEPTAARTDRLSADGHRRARELAVWKQRVVAAWPSVRLMEVDGDAAAVTDLGDVRGVTVEVDLATLSSDDVAVELLHGPVVAGDEMATTEIVGLELAGPAGGGEGGSRYLYRGSFACEQAGRHGFTVRVVPAHPDQTTGVETGCVAWS
ncbi:MAG TPA: alpha-glucan family phosphorylase [Acidimicrobiales bacterium]|jgi:starch phosphorylase|nr:alpha-glucan family phosphorylase [Acidimicrobiales bacterium]